MKSHGCKVVIENNIKDLEQSIFFETMTQNKPLFSKELLKHQGTQENIHFAWGLIYENDQNDNLPIAPIPIVQTVPYFLPIIFKSMKKGRNI